MGRSIRLTPPIATKFEPKFPTNQIPYWASRYSYPGEDNVVDTLAPKARARGYLTRQEFLTLCEWKTPRSKSKCARNSAARIRDATQLAFATTDDRAKIGILRLLDGVEWPTASVILHFCDQLPYPILDYRALWSLGYKDPPAYNFDFWRDYTAYTRELARRSGHSMRNVDRALWQYSNQETSEHAGVLLASLGCVSRRPGSRGYRICPRTDRPVPRQPGTCAGLDPSRRMEPASHQPGGTGTNLSPG